MMMLTSSCTIKLAKLAVSSKTYEQNKTFAFLVVNRRNAECVFIYLEVIVADAKGNCVQIPKDEGDCGKYPIILLKLLKLTLELTLTNLTLEFGEELDSLLNLKH